MRICQQGAMSQNNLFTRNPIRQTEDITPSFVEVKPMVVGVRRLDKTKSIFQSCLHCAILRISFPRLLITSLLSNPCLINFLLETSRFFIRTHNPTLLPPLSSFCPLCVFPTAHVYRFNTNFMLKTSKSPLLALFPL